MTISTYIYVHRFRRNKFSIIILYNRIFFFDLIFSAKMHPLLFISAIQVCCVEEQFIETKRCLFWFSLLEDAPEETIQRFIEDSCKLARLHHKHIATICGATWLPGTAQRQYPCFIYSHEMYQNLKHFLQTKLKSFSEVRCVFHVKLHQISNFTIHRKRRSLNYVCRFIQRVWKSME